MVESLSVLFSPSLSFDKTFILFFISLKLVAFNISSGSINVCKSLLTKFIKELDVTSSRVDKAREKTNSLFFSRSLYFAQSYIMTLFPITEFYLSYFFENIRNVFEIFKNLITSY